MLRCDPTSVSRSCRLTRQDATQHPPRPTVLVIRFYCAARWQHPVRVQGVMQREIGKGLGGDDALTAHQVKGMETD
ncbi:unnamed protein product [Lasius platythorax]|uniref:Uncharacterized protein n=1 Tax=Lasius platythorax TaxID=488582 RepID=A0AAV2P6A8_9HYME